MNNIFDNMRDAVADADRALRAADSCSSDMARLLVGRLRQVQRFGCTDTDTLRALKRELRDFNMVTGRWDR